MTIYARQVDPEFQKSPLWIDGCYENEPVIVIVGEYIPLQGYVFESVHRDLYNRIVDCYDELVDEMHDIQRKVSPYYNNLTEAIKDLFCEYDIKLNTRVVGAVKKCLEKSGTRDYYNGTVYIEMLRIFTGLYWQKVSIAGCVQRDWAEILYYGDFDVRDFEEMYFNTGTEWCIHDSDEEVTCADDIDGYYTYITDAWNNNMIKEKISDITGCKPEEVVLYVHSGYTRNSVYEVA